MLKRKRCGVRGISYLYWQPQNHPERFL